jgi:hypothetical protein
MPASRIRRGPILLAALVVLVTLSLALASGGGGAGASPSVNPSFLPVVEGCQNWCGSGSATVTLGGATTTISGGGCYDMGAAGVDARFGDWQGVQGVSSYLQLIAFRAGGATPTTAATRNPQLGPDATAYPPSNVNGSVNGNPFVLDSAALITLAADGRGTFSGNDVNGLGLVKGTFNCG